MSGFGGSVNFLSFGFFEGINWRSEIKVRVVGFESRRERRFLSIFLSGSGWLLKNGCICCNINVLFFLFL